MRVSKSVVLLAVFLLLFAVFPGPYLIRWLAVLSLGLFLGLYLFGFEVKVARPRFGRPSKVEVKTDIERTVGLIKKAETGKVARSLIEEKIIDIYATLSDDYNSTFGSLRSHPNDALRTCLLYTSPSPRDGLLSRMPSSA
jgi:hypothetical protein